MFIALTMNVDCLSSLFFSLYELLGTVGSWDHKLKVLFESCPVILHIIKLKNGQLGEIWAPFVMMITCYWGEITASYLHIWV